MPLRAVEVYTNADGETSRYFFEVVGDRLSVYRDVASISADEPAAVYVRTD